MVDIPQSLINSYVKKVKDSTGKNLRQFFGDVEIALNTEYSPRWEVAAFKVGRDEYGKLKQAYCDQFGSN